MIDNDPLIGKQLANFLIERVLGRGGMAQVYYGHDVKLQRPVAIKVIDARYRNKPSYAQRFVKEARSVAKWRHQNIIQIYYADDTDGLYYYVMEYIGGHDLSSVMASYTGMGELMPSTEILRIGRAVASALDYAHQQGIIHRDVKPSNILMSEDGRVVLGDFGLALDMQEGSTGEIFGTPHYISPEQARQSKDVVPQSDLYALGVILYEILTGAVPFDDPSPTSVALQHCTQPPPPPRLINPNISEQTEQVLLKALSKLPEDRYQTGGALMDALEKALMEDPILPLPPIPAAVISAQAPTVFQTPGSVEIEIPVAEKPVSQPTQPVAKQKSRSGFWLVLGLLALAVLLFFGVMQFSPRSLQALLAAFPAPSSTTLPSPTAEPKTPSPLPPTTIPSPTPAPSATETITAQTVVATLPPALPSETVSPTASEALTASLTPETTSESLSATPTATETPLAITETATGEPESSATPNNTPNAIPTLKYPNGKRFTLFYDARGLYMLNASDKNRPLESFAFDRLNDAGQPLNHFEGFRWSQFYPIIYAQNCIKIELVKQAEYPARPTQCENRTLGGRFYDHGSEFLFWTPQENSHFFRVLWKNEEVAQCEISRGICEVFVP